SSSRALPVKGTRVASATYCSSSSIRLRKPLAAEVSMPAPASSKCSGCDTVASPSVPSGTLFFLLQHGVDHGGNETAHIAPQEYYLFDDAGTEKQVLGLGHDEHGFNGRFQFSVHLGHLELRLKVGDGPEPLDDDVHPPAAGIFHQQAVTGVHLHV